MFVGNQNSINFMHRNKESDRYLFLNDITSILVSGEDTNGAFCVVQGTAKKDSGPTLHIHEHEDESFYVLEGEVTIFVGDKTILAKTGDYVFAPRGIPHTLKINSEVATLLVTAYPAGFDSFVKELGVPYHEGMEKPTFSPSDETLKHLVEVSKKYNITYPNL